MTLYSQRRASMAFSACNPWSPWRCATAQGDKGPRRPRRPTGSGLWSCNTLPRCAWGSSDLSEDIYIQAHHTRASSVAYFQRRSSSPPCNTRRTADLWILCARRSAPPGRRRVARPPHRFLGALFSRLFSSYRLHLQQNSSPALLKGAWSCHGQDSREYGRRRARRRPLRPRPTGCSSQESNSCTATGG